MGNLAQKRLFLLDMDGTIYLDETLFPSTPPFLAYIRQIGGRYLFLTNNSSRGVGAYVEKMQRLGITATPDDFLTSVDATIEHLQQTHPSDLLYVFGTQTFCAQLRDAGLRVTTQRSDEVKALVIGFDTELTFQKLEDACILLGSGVDFIATNPDWVCPTWYGSVPDCGSVCEMLFRATSRRPLVIGKPKPEMAYLAMKRTGYAPEQTVLIGDRVYTDIACGVNAGIDTVLVLSGEGTVADIVPGESEPTWVMEDVGALLQAIKREESTQ
jgi:HAD superfamily hydrolase (TIGR01450 family)